MVGRSAREAVSLHRVVPHAQSQHESVRRLVFEHDPVAGLDQLADRLILRLRWRWQAAQAPERAVGKHPKPRGRSRASLVTCRCRGSHRRWSLRRPRRSALAGGAGGVLEEALEPGVSSRSRTRDHRSRKLCCLHVTALVSRPRSIVVVASRLVVVGAGGIGAGRRSWIGAGYLAVIQVAGDPGPASVASTERGRGAARISRRLPHANVNGPGYGWTSSSTRCRGRGPRRSEVESHPQRRIIGIRGFRPILRRNDMNDRRTEVFTAAAWRGSRRYWLSGASPVTWSTSRSRRRRQFIYKPLTVEEPFSPEPATRRSSNHSSRRQGYVRSEGGARYRRRSAHRRAR